MTAPVIAETPVPTTATPTYPAALQALVQAYSVQQAAVVAQALAEVVDLWPLLDLDNLDATAGPWTRRMVQTVDTYRDRAFGNADSFYDRFRSARIGEPLSLTPMRAVSADEKALSGLFGSYGPANIKHKTLRLAAEREHFGDNRPHYMETVSRYALVDVMGATTQGVVDGARQAMDQKMTADREVVGYQRVLRSAHPCSFCVMLASRGPVFIPQNDAGLTVRNSASPRYGKSYHPNCQCELLPVYDEDEPWLEDALEYRFAWDRVTEGHSTDDARRVWRRYWEGRTPNGNNSSAVQDAEEASGAGQGAA